MNVLHKDAFISRWMCSTGVSSLYLLSLGVHFHFRKREHSEEFICDFSYN